MGVFFIDTSRGTIATANQLREAGVAIGSEPPPRPWFRIQGSSDATTMWYAVLRKRVKDVYIGTLCIRHGDHHASLLAAGWEEVPVDQIGPPASG